MSETPLTEEERALLVEYATDAVVFAAGASVETSVGLGRWDGPESIAREFVDARLPVEVERIVAARVAAARADERERVTSVVTDVLNRTDWSDKSAMVLGSAIAWSLDNDRAALAQPADTTGADQ